MDVGISVSGVVVLVSTWAAGVASAPNSGAVLPAPLVGMVGKNTRSSCWKTTWHRTGAASMATKLFSPTQSMDLGAVLALGLNPDGGERRTWLKNWSEGQTLVQSGPARHNYQELARLYIVVGGCVQNYHTRQLFM